jgi:hypothetical protein
LMTKPRNHPNPSNERDDIMTHRWTRFQDETERQKKVYEDLDVVLATAVGNDRADEKQTVEEFCELVKSLTGVTSDGSYDPDTATVGRCAARQWLRRVGYIA